VVNPPKWHEGRMVALDTETTSTDPLTARIVTAAVVHITPGQRPSTISWVIDPGIPVPDEAAAIHGWTDERIAAHIGRPGQDRLAVRLHNGHTQRLTADAALFEIAAQAATAMAADAPLVVMNAAYDLTLLEAECARNDVPTLSSRPTGIRGVVDPMVIEKAYDPYRKLCYKAPGCRPAEQHHECSGCRGGKYRCGGCGAHNKQLLGLCLHYGIRHAGAHDASADAIAAVRILKRIVEAWPDIARLRLGTLHQHQVGWRREQMLSLRSYFDRNQIEHDGCDPGWPLLQTPAVA
jgi:DNA polymerase-3 subunit epsilon